MVSLTHFRPRKSRANYPSLPSQVQRYSKPSPTYLYSPSAWARCGIAALLTFSLTSGVRPWYNQCCRTMRPDSGRGFLFFGVRELAPAFPPSPHSSYGEKPPQSATRGRKKRDRKSTRLNSSHTVISYAVFCLKKKTRRLAGQR